MGLGCIAIALLSAGCLSVKPPTGSVVPEFRAAHAAVPVRLDGRLDDAVWQQAEVYPLRLADNLPGTAGGPIERGSARFAWDDDFFYLAVTFDDSDVVADGTQNGQHHYQMGDVAELFLWPEALPWYTEMYVTPKGHYSTFLFPGAGRRLPGCTATNAFSLRVAATVEGTRNDFGDRDRQWSGEMAVPVKEFMARGASWGPGSVWRVLVGRYNYSIWLPKEELSELPGLPTTNFHLRENYGRLILQAPPTPPATP